MDELMGQKTLMDDFPEVTKDQWIYRATKDLKGLPFETLTQTKENGIKIAPFYTLEDGVQQLPLFNHTDWEIAENIDVYDDRLSNQLALSLLNQGATALAFKLYHTPDFKVLLQDIGLDYIAVSFQFFEDVTETVHSLKLYLHARNFNESSLNFTYNYDPIATLVSSGILAQNLAELPSAYLAFISNASVKRNLCINSEIYHEAGASPAWELACTLAHATEYLNWVSNEKQSFRVQLNVAAGSDYFMEIAKLRALRKVFALLLEQYIQPTTLYIHCSTAARHLTVLDSNNNLMRSTTSSMAAIAGGCNSLNTLPYNFTYQETNDFSNRMARNIQLILKGESYFDKISDVAAGSFYLQQLTDELAQKAWSIFQGIEANGGFLASLKSGFIQQNIAESNNLEQTQFEEGKKILVGVNKFPAAPNAEEANTEHAKPNSQNTPQYVLPILPVRLAAAMEERMLKEKLSNA